MSEEYQALQIAMDRIEQYPTFKQYLIAYIPTLLIFLSTVTILTMAYQCRGIDSLEKQAPNISTILSVMMLILELFLIVYQNHSRFDVLKTMIGIALRINLVHLILSSSFISFVKNGGDFNTYASWISGITLPIFLLSGIPLFSDIFVYDYS